LAPFHMKKIFYLVRSEVPDAQVEANIGHLVVDLREFSECSDLVLCRLVDGLKTRTTDHSQRFH